MIFGTVCTSQEQFLYLSWMARVLNVNQVSLLFLGWVSRVTHTATSGNCSVLNRVVASLRKHWKMLPHVNWVDLVTHFCDRSLHKRLHSGVLFRNSTHIQSPKLWSLPPHFCRTQMLSSCPSFLPCKWRFVPKQRAGESPYPKDFSCIAYKRHCFPSALKRH